MSGVIKAFLIVSIISLTTVSCQNYYYFGGQQKVKTDKPDQYEKLVLTFENGKQTLPFYMYGDYQAKRANKEYIFFKNSEMKRLLHNQLPQKNGEQFLFIYTDQPTFSNILGFYYKDLYVNDIKAQYSAINRASGQNQAFYKYAFGKFQVFDLYKNVDGGVIRFITVNNPEYTKDPDYKWYNREINTMFFDINQSLWEGYVEPLN